MLLSSYFRAFEILLIVIVCSECLIACDQQSSDPRPGSDSTKDTILHSVSALVDGTAFVRIQAGEFTMGSRDGNPDEQPERRVRITQPFELSKIEITQAQWIAVMQEPHRRSNTKQGPADVNPSHFKGPSRPVENVTWEAVQEFVRKLNVRDPKHVYRLPTEAEWEYAARAGSEQPPSNLDTLAWHQANSGDETHPVAQKEPNAWGVHDMLGNVQEWVQDWYDPVAYSDSRAVDPKGPASGSYKVYRGCAWLSEAKYCRPGFRAFDFPANSAYSVGFRLVRLPK